MQSRDHQGEGSQGGHQGANTAGNKNQLAGNEGNPRYQQSSGNKSQHHDPHPHIVHHEHQKAAENSASVQRHPDPNRSRLILQFGQKHGLNQRHSESAADSFLGSVNWASQQQRDNDFKDFVNPQTPYTKNPLYDGWKGEYKNRLLSSGFDDENADRLASEEPDEYMRELSNHGADENWYRNYGNDGRDVSDDVRNSGYNEEESDERSRTDHSSSRVGNNIDEISLNAFENSDGTDAEGMTNRVSRTDSESEEEPGRLAH